MVLGIWGFGGLSVCADVTCAVNGQELLNFSSYSVYQLDKITTMSLRFSVSSSAKWEESVPQARCNPEPCLLALPEPGLYSGFCFFIRIYIFTFFSYN